MLQPSIHVENLSKRYRIGLREQTNDTLVGTVTNLVRQPFQNLRRLQSLTRFSEDGEEGADVLWALKDVSFEVQQGEVVGIIGRNGAGKSTLLKILSRITHPTSGRVELRGRVSSLLEVGTGFHPELTGRENIYLNGTILGMRKKEIDRKFDEIVAFSGVEKFIDTPVKRYSSGMRVRLAFSVAAHLEPEILLIDEVLAVGDAEFQKMCLGKMSEVAEGGRTVLFVSHNMGAIQNMCNKTIFLDYGRIVLFSDTESAIDAYLQQSKLLIRETSLDKRTDRTGGEKFRFQSISLFDSTTRIPLNTIISGKDLMIKVKYFSLANDILRNVVISIGFFTISGSFLFACRSDSVGSTFDIYPGEGQVFCFIPKLPLSPGRYTYNLMGINQHETLDWVIDAGYIDVSSGDFYGSGKLPASNYQGLLVKYHWEQEAKKTIR